MSPVARQKIEMEADTLLTRGDVFRSARLYRSVDHPLSSELLIERGNEFLRKGNITAAAEAFVCAGFRSVADSKK